MDHYSKFDIIAGTMEIIEEFWEEWLDKMFFFV